MLNLIIFSLQNNLKELEWMKQERMFEVKICLF